MSGGRRGRLWVLSAPSGAGKTTLVRALTAARPGLRFSISYTTRPPRSGERDGTDYLFVSHDTFEEMVANDAFLEHAEVFGNRYGTGRAQVEALLAAGHDVILEIDWQGARQVRARMPECASVFIMPPSLAALEQRLRGRGTDDDAVIRRRLAQARDDIAHWSEFDYVIVNDRLADAEAALIAIVDGAGETQRRDRPEVAATVAAILGDPASGEPPGA